MNDFNIILPFGNYVVSHQGLYTLMVYSFLCGGLFILVPRFIERINVKRWIFMHALCMLFGFLLMCILCVFSMVDPANQDSKYHTQKQLLLYILVFSYFASGMVCFQNYKSITSNTQTNNGKLFVFYLTNRDRYNNSCNFTVVYCVIQALLFFLVVIPIPWTPNRYAYIIIGMIIIAFIRNITAVYRHLQYKEESEFI